MSRFWARFFPFFYRLLRFGDPLIERVWRRFGLGNVVEIVTTGRRSGAPRAAFVGVLRVGEREYVGHPNGHAAWVGNILANPEAEIRAGDGTSRRVRAIPLPDGPERAAAIRAAFRQHPFPGGVIYWLARSHVRSAGTYFRLEPVGPEGAADPGEPAAGPDRFAV